MASPCVTDDLSQVTNFNIFWVVWKTDPLVRHLLMEVLDMYIYILRLTCGFQHDTDAPHVGSSSLLDSWALSRSVLSHQRMVSLKAEGACRGV